ncbi:hypothetical protein MMC25_007638 [Agyrium rufum]|nr:hypothetical protein [Agyrium rufum]
MAPIQFGILCIPFQMLDVVGPLDILLSSTKSNLKFAEQIDENASDFGDRGYDIEIHYIGATMEPVAATGDCKIQPSTTCATCPKLDYLLVGGPLPDFFLNIPPVYAEFMRDRAEELKAFFTTCTGGMVVAMTGLLDGKTATTNHQILPMAKKLKPEVNWVAEQWVVDGKFWTAGGACAGMDMFAHWIKENHGQDIGEAGWATLDYEPRDIKGKLIELKTGLRVN